MESGSDAHLHPEQSDNETLGVSITPPSLPWLDLSVDYYHYRIQDAIDSLADSDPNLIPDLCYESAHLSSPICGLITRIGGGGNAGQIGNILALDQNVGTIKTQGLEFGATATRKIPGGVQLRVDSQTNWLLDFRLRTVGENAFTQYAGTFPGLGAGGSYARVKSRTTADLDWGAMVGRLDVPLHLRRARPGPGGRHALFDRGERLLRGCRADAAVQAGHRHGGCR